MSNILTALCHFTAFEDKLNSALSLFHANFWNYFDPFKALRQFSFYFLLCGSGCVVDLLPSV